VGALLAALLLLVALLVLAGRSAAEAGAGQRGGLGACMCCWLDLAPHPSCSLYRPSIMQLVQTIASQFSCMQLAACLLCKLMLSVGPVELWVLMLWVLMLWVQLS
jgi:hypothetical protein